MTQLKQLRIIELGELPDREKHFWSEYCTPQCKKTKYIAVEDLKPLVEALKDTQSWLGRMKDLFWRDPTYAPKFKASFEENKKTLALYAGLIGDGE